ncbi:MAG: dihydroneopterin aldolase [Cyclobacteriaceae bacterium]|jgi:dihydroneopterin aldolase
MGKIKLEGMIFFAYHGVSDEEQQIGNRYTVNVTITTDFLAAAKVDSIAGTIDYEKIYIIVNQIMQENTRLLESLAFRIAEKLKATFGQAEKVLVSVSKHNPPIKGNCDLATVELEM